MAHISVVAYFLLNRCSTISTVYASCLSPSAQKQWDFDGHCLLAKGRQQVDASNKCRGTLSFSSSCGNVKEGTPNSTRVSPTFRHRARVIP